MPNDPKSQFDLFPRASEVEAVDPQTAIGPRTRVSKVFRVRYEGEARVHQVLVDRHGWYCSDHGTECAAVAEARRATE